MKSILILSIPCFLFTLVLIFLKWARTPSVDPITKQMGLVLIPNDPPPFSANRFRSMTFNIGYAGGLDTLGKNRLSKSEIETNLETISQIINRNEVDILAVQEIDLASKRSCFINQVDYISRTCNFPFFAFAYTWDLKWVPYPFTLNPINHFGKVLAGQAVFSKFPILDQTITTFPKPRANNPLYNSFFLDRVLQTVTLQLETDFGVNIHNVHLEAFHKEARLNQIRSIVDLLQKPKIALPSIILGDFNAIAQGSIEIDRFPDSPNIDYGKDPTLETLLNLNEWDEVGSEKPDLKTFPSDSPNRRLDYIFYSNAAFSLDETFVDPNVNGASDHLPILADFSTFKN